MDILGIIELPTWLVLTAVLVVLAYLYGTWTHDHFKKMGVPGPKPYPFMGNTWQLFFKFSNIKKYDEYLTQTYGKIVGIFEGRTPVLLVYDPEMVKQVMVKQFHNFVNKVNLVKLEDKYIRVMLSTLEDDHWKHVRHLMTPSFTTGKLKQMHYQLNKCADLLIENLTEKVGEVVSIKEYSSAFTFDAISRTAFGLEVNTQKEPDNPFIKHAKAIMTPTAMRMIVIFFFPFLIKPLKWIGLNIFPKDSQNYIFNMSAKIMEDRAKSKYNNADFLQLMMDAHLNLPTKEDLEDEELMSSFKEDRTGEWSKKGLTKEEVIGNLALFFLAGYETTSTTLTSVLYFLAIYPQAMERLVQEVDQVVGTQESVTPDMTSRLNFTEQCIMEALRLRTLAFRTNREAKNTINLGGIVIPKGQRVDIPIHALQQDPEVYPEPEKFDPDRFTPEARAARDPVYWMPFGYGPRNCIGLRLAMVELKIALAKIFQKFRVKRCEETVVPLQYNMGVLKRPIKLRVETRMS